MMADTETDEVERSLDISYKRACEFEKPRYEKLYVDDSGSVVLTVDKELYMQSENNERLSDDFFEPVKYSSYGDLFNNRYRNNFKRNLVAIKYTSLENELGKDTLTKITQRDQELRQLYTRLTKERDLDNDGIPDRIDIDDTRNSVQSTKDLDSVKNSTSASTQRYNEKQDRRHDKERQRDNEMEL